MRPERLYGFILILACVGWAYAPVRDGGFVYQDARWMDACAGAVPSVLSVDGWRRSLMRATWCGQVGASSEAFHRVNLVLFMTVIWLTWLLVWRMSRDEALAWWTAGILSSNILAVESVAYLSGRGELLAAIFILSTSICAVEGYWIAMMGCALLAVAGKETGVIALPVALLFMARQRSWHGGWVLMGVGLMASAVLGVASWWVEHLATWPSWIMQQSTAMIGSAFIGITQTGATISHEYHTMPLIVGMLCLVTLTALAVWSSTHWRSSEMALGVVIALIALLPRLLVQTPGALFTDHHAFMPLIGGSLAVAAWGRE